MLDCDSSNSIREARRLSQASRPVALDRQSVVTVHGLAAHQIAMWPIGRRLGRRGFRTHHFGYWSIRARVEEVAVQLGRRLDRFEADPGIERLHLVTHSMGGIVARTLLQRRRYRKLHRIVMLAPPNAGSHVATKLAGTANWVLPAIEQLADRDDSYVNQLNWGFGANDIELGVVAARHDRVIRLPSTLHPSQKEFAVIDGNHGPMPWNQNAAGLVEAFLLTGTFFGVPQSAV